MSVKSAFTVKQLTVTAMLMALNLAFSTFSLPVPGGHLYLNDVVVCTAAILLDPFPAFLVGGVGAFIGDFLFYPAPMFVSLVTHGLQAVVISLCCRRLMPQRREGLFGASAWPSEPSLWWPATASAVRSSTPIPPPPCSSCPIRFCRPLSGLSPA